MLNSRTMKFGIPAAFLAVAVVAALAMWAFMGASASGENALIKTNVEWKVFGADGVLKSQGAGHNYTSLNLITDARARLSAASTVDADTIYSNISACSTASTGVTANGGTPTGACTLSSNLTSNTGAGLNPTLATIAATSPSATTRAYTATTTFTSGVGGSTINELELSKTLVATTAPTTSTIGAVKLVTIVLAATDTLQITWTVTIS